MASNNRNKSNFIVQGSILAFTSIIVRLIGVLYRIPLNNILGPQGVGIYGIAFDVYSILLIISSYSLPLAVSKLVSARVIVGQMKNSFKIFLGALFFSSIIGVIVSVFTYFFSNILANVWQSPESAIALKVLAPTLLIMSVVGVFRGYFQGLGTMLPTAISQILEQISNAIISIVAAKVLFDLGKHVKNASENYQYPYAYGAAGGTLGTSIGALTALLFLLYIFFIYKKNIAKQNRMDNTNVTESYSYIIKMLFITIIPVILSTTIYNISGFLDSAVFSNVMKIKEMDKDLRQTLLGFNVNYKMIMSVPIALAAALSSSIIPSITASISIGKKGQVINKINLAIRFSMIIAFPCAVGLAVLAAPIISLLFPSVGDVAISARMIQFGAISVVFYSISTITNAILQGINKMRLPVRHAFISLVIHFILLILLLFTTNLNIYAVVITDVIFSLVITILNAFSLRKHLSYKQEILKTFILPAVASLLMGVVSYFSYHLINKISSNTFATISSIFISIIIYGILLLVLKVVDESELYRLPKGKSIVNIAKKLHLLR